MEEQREQQSHHLSSQTYSDVCPDDEVNLLDFWRVLVRQWKVIGAITGLSVLGAVAYVLLVTPVYEAQAVVKPPENKDVEVLNIPDISQTTSADIFAKFVWNLKSSSVRQQFFDENPQFSSLRNNKQKVTEGMKNEAGFIFLSFQGHDAKLVADWVNDFIVFAEKETINNWLLGIEISIANRKKKIENEIQIDLDFANRRRQDRIVLLANQIAVARASKIYDRKLSSYTAMTSQSVGVTLNTAQEPLYMRGVKELAAEKAELEKRKNDEPFIDGFRDKQERLAQLDAGLKQLQAERANIHAGTVDLQAVAAQQPVKPKRSLVLAMGVIMGAVFGVIASFLLDFFQQRREKIELSEECASK